MKIMKINSTIGAWSLAASVLCLGFATRLPAAPPPYYLKVDANSNQVWLEGTMLGTCLVSDKVNRNTDWTVFKNTFNRVDAPKGIGLRTLEYPTGTLDDPERKVNGKLYDYPNCGPTDGVNLLDVMEFYQNNVPAITLILNVPVYRFLSQDEIVLLPKAEEYARNLVTAVNIDKIYHPNVPEGVEKKKVTYWELGSECYRFDIPKVAPGDPPQLTPTKYARIVYAQAKAMREVDQDVKCIIGFDRNHPSKTEEIYNKLHDIDEHWNTYIQKCTPHALPGSDPTQLGNVPDSFLTGRQKLHLDNPDDEVVTQWNTGAVPRFLENGDPNPSFTTGLKNANWTLSLFKKMTEGGIRTLACNFTLMFGHNTGSSYANFFQSLANGNNDEGRIPGSLRPPGQVTRWLAEIINPGPLVAGGVWWVASAAGTGTGTIMEPGKIDVLAFKRNSPAKLSVLIPCYQIDRYSNIYLTINDFTFSTVTMQRMYDGNPSSPDLHHPAEIQPATFAVNGTTIQFQGNYNSFNEVIRLDLTP